MKERSLVERFVAILGVLVGTVAWVVRLLLSLLKGLLSGGKPDSAEAGDGRAPDPTGQRGSSRALTRIRVR